MHIAGGAANRFVLDRPMAAAAAPMGLAGHGAAGLSSLLHESHKGRVSQWVQGGGHGAAQVIVVHARARQINAF